MDNPEESLKEINNNNEPRQNNRKQNKTKNALPNSRRTNYEGLGEVKWPFRPPHLNLNLQKQKDAQPSSTRNKGKTKKCFSHITEMLQGLRLGFWKETAFFENSPFKVANPQTPKH